ncbi:hypothetical protein [Herbaspirillum sp. ST 5-3]|uniref:hypothetical protein n=1 Tax=Oxalobacteraceae TaxID=75682 RepID=UPI0010A2C88D|nr:hypothetical protein [Herbaspirillum sp. ST 5-3]
MKKSLITTLVAVPLLSLSSMAFAAEPASSEPMLLSSAEMDGVTAGVFVFKWAQVNQLNASPVTIAQANVLTLGGGNYAAVVSGNTAVIHQ